jgi:hypothetical protein
MPCMREQLGWILLTCVTMSLFICR